MVMEEAKVRIASARETVGVLRPEDGGHAVSDAMI